MRRSQNEHLLAINNSSIPFVYFAMASSKRESLSAAVASFSWATARSTNTVLLAIVDNIFTPLVDRATGPSSQITRTRPKIRIPLDLESYSSAKPSFLDTIHSFH